MIMVIILLLCIISAISFSYEYCFHRQETSIISQISTLFVFLIALTSPALMAMPSSFHWQIAVVAHHHLTISLYYNALTWVMMCLVSFISLVIHSYAARYLRSDLNQKRFMGQLSLLTFSVLLLTMSGSLFTAFIAWQFIGLSLYLLLNHYHYDVRANKAAKKKFMINRVGDICFLLAVVITLYQYGNTEFTLLFAQGANFNPVILILVFIAIMTKSAQFPFHIWLIDTMEAPTPVSALMHAGVINAGGFLLARLSPLYDHFTYLLFFIFVVGLSTALLGNFFMRNQSDVKKQLAYSTMGQMGYMLMQCGLGCFASAVFHLIVHGFFKASLFLSSGSTLKQANQITNHQQKQTYHYAAWIISILLTILLTGIGVYYFSFNNHGVYLNPLLWLFIAISLVQLIKTGLLQARKLSVKCLLTLTIIAIFLIYLIVLKHFNILLSHSIAEHRLPLLGWIVGASLLIIILLGFLFKLLPPSHLKRNLIYKLYLFGFYKGNVEKNYRQYLINPIRLWGDRLLRVFQRLHVGWRRSILLLLFIYLIISVIAILLAMRHDIFPRSLTLLSVNLILLLLILLIANRVHTLPQLAMTLLLSALLITTIAFMTGNRDISVIGSFQCVNSLLIMLGFLLLLLKRYQAHTSIALRQNRLPWSHFYMGTFLMLLIGIPGTASFVSELYLLYSLIQLHVIWAAIFGTGMVLLALAVLHALQIHFFNPATIKQNRTIVSPWLHGVCVLIIGLNLFNGIHPAPLTRIISTITGA
ncbi:MAG: proton-conducting transporter membrane subunit [Pseudomonadota bacterium]